MEVRRAEYRDMPRIMDLLMQVELVHHHGRPDIFRNGGTKYTDDELRAIIDDEDTPVFVAAEGDEVLGHAFCQFQQKVDHNILTDIRTLYIDDICVDENCRGKHVGTALYEHVRDFARSVGCYNITLNVWSFNEPAMRFYEKCGLAPQRVYMETVL